MRLLRLVAVAAVLLIPADAHAYLDPRSGSMLLQALLGGVAGVAVLARVYWRRLRAWVSHLRQPVP